MFHAALRMAHKISNFWLAFIFGSLSEGAFDGLIAWQGNGGPCNISFLALIGLLWHAPGLLISYPLLAMSRPDNHDAWGYAALGVACVIGALTFTALYYFIIRWLRRPKPEDADKNSPLA